MLIELEKLIDGYESDIRLGPYEVNFLASQLEINQEVLAAMEKLVERIKKLEEKVEK